MNEGKIFEKDIKASIPENTYYLKLPDASIGFDIENSTQRFAPKSPYDNILYRNGRMHALELKSTKSGRVSFRGKSPMIKQHQIDELIRAASFGIEAGFILNYRETLTCYIPINAFCVFAEESEKKSINSKDAEDIGILIPQRKLKVHYRYDLTVFVK